MQGMRKTPIIWKSGGGQTGYLIVFYGNGGTSEVFSARTNADGKLDSLPTATRENYNFLGWQTEDGTDVTTETVFSEDTMLEAQWKLHAAQVLVYGNDDTFYASYATISGENVYSEGTYTVEIGESVSIYGYDGTVVNGAVQSDGSSSFIVRTPYVVIGLGAGLARIYGLDSLDPVDITVSGTGGGANVSVDGTELSTGAHSLAIGTKIGCKVKAGKDKTGYIYLNDEVWRSVNGPLLSSADPNTVSAAYFVVRQAEIAKSGSLKEGIINITES